MLRSSARTIIQTFSLLAIISAARERNCLRILLVEDEPNAARMMAKGLREQTYAVDVAQDGEGALYHANVNDYDLIILDIMLPGKDGFEVCRELRAAEIGRASCRERE